MSYRKLRDDNEPKLFVILEKKKQECDKSFDDLCEKGESDKLEKVLKDLKKIEIEYEGRWHTSNPEEARLLWLMHWQEVEDYYLKLQEIVREGERLLQQEEQLEAELNKPMTGIELRKGLKYDPVLRRLVEKKD